MIVTAYDSNLNMLGHKFYSGARYIAEIEVDPDQETITLYGQADRTITISWDELVRLTRVTSTVLTATPNPAVKGEQVTLTAEVMGDLPVSGEVVFKLGSSTLGTKNLGPDGTATLTTTDLPVGTHTLTAEYLGDENSSGSVSNKVTLIVENKEFTVTFDSKGGSAVDGQTVEEGSLLEEPVSTRGGYTLEGWYRNEDYTDQWDFENDTVTEDMTLYAKWRLNDPPTATEVTLKSNNAHNQNYAKIGDIVTLAFTASEDVTGVAVTIAGQAAAVSDAGDDDAATWTTSYTLQAGDPEGNLSFTLDFESLFGQKAEQVTSTTDGSKVIADFTAPTGNVQYSATDLTNQDVVATLVPSEDVVVTNHDGLDYIFVQNGSFTFQFRDHAGNTGSVEATVNHIDKEKPEAPTLTPSTTEATNGNVTVTISYPADAFQKLYRVDDGNWLAYETELEMDKNAEVSAKAVDQAGNESEISSLEITNIDKEKPVISLIGDAVLQHEAKTPFTDPGVAATDNQDGDLAAIVEKTGSVNVDQIGNYELRYNVTDAAGNAADEKVRTVEVVDTTKPVITLQGDAHLTHEAKTTFTDPGATAADSYDGDLTGSIQVSGTVNADQLGTYELRYSVSDSSGNTEEVVRTVEVIDTTKPVITLQGDTHTTHEAKTTFTDPGATAVDSFDGDLTESIQVSGTVNVDQLGTYELRYSVSDSSGNTAEEVRTVEVVDTTKPVITLLGDQTMYVSQSDPYQEPGAEAVDHVDGPITVNISGAVDMSQPGTYTLVYTAEDSSGNIASVERTVHVLSNDATLRQLIADAGPMNPEFSQEVYEYSIDVSYRIAQITLQLQVNEENAELRANGEVVDLDETGSAQIILGLKVGMNPLVIDVKAQDGSIQTYRVEINRAERDERSAPSVGSQPNLPPASRPVPQEGSIDILVNGNAESAGTVTRMEAEGQEVTTVQVDGQKIVERLESEGEGAVVTIPVQAGSEVVISELTGQTVSNMVAQQAVLEIQTERAVYTLPAEQIDLDAIVETFGTNPQLEDIKIHVEISTPPVEIVQILESAEARGELALVVPPIQFHVRAELDGRTVEVSQFSSYVERMIRIPDHVDASRITTGVVVEPDGTVRHVPTKIIMQNGQHYAVINSLTNSVYSVIWNPVEFLDVKGHWSEAAVNDMGSRLIISGNGKGHFLPDRAVTRAEFATILIRALGLRLETEGRAFADVLPGAWYHDAVQTAQAHGLIDGFADGTFRPNATLTREQAMTMIAKAMRLTGLADSLKPAEGTDLLSKYSDASSVADWAKQGVNDSLRAGIISGRGNALLAPKAQISRAEVAVIIQRLLRQSDLI